MFIAKMTGFLETTMSLRKVEQFVGADKALERFFEL